MNFNDLRYYQALYNKKNFSKVAQEFKVSQPTISSAVKRLEETFNAVLIVRGNSLREPLITPAGHQLYVHAEKILAELTTARNEIERESHQNIILGLPPLIENCYFAKIAHSLKQAHLLDNITVYEGGSNTLRHELLMGNLDLSLMGSLEPTSPTSDLIFDNFARNDFCVYVSHDHPLAHSQGVYFNELQHETFVFLSSSFVHSEAIKQFSSHANFTPRVLFNSKDINFLINLVAESVGITILATIADPHRTDIVRVPLLDDEQPHFYSSIAYRANHVFTSKQNDLLDTIRNHI